MLPAEFVHNARPRSEVINRSGLDSNNSNAWREDLRNYERNLEEMTSVDLDQSFKEELQHVDQWFRFLSETERTTTVYALLQHSSQVQIRFFISVLQQLLKRDPANAFLTPASTDQDIQSHLAGPIAQAELEANHRIRQAAGHAIRRPPSAGSTNEPRRAQIDRHSLALGDTEEYSRIFGSTSNTSLLNLNSSLDDFGRGRIPRAPTTNNSNQLFGGRASTTSRPRSVIEGDSSLLFPSGGSSAWLNPPRTNPAGLRMPPQERPKSADVSLWSFDRDDHFKPATTTAASATSSAAAAAAVASAAGSRASWGVPSTMQFGDLAMPGRSDTDYNKGWDPQQSQQQHQQQQRQQTRRQHPANRNSTSIPGTVPETDEHDPILLSMYDSAQRARSPVPSASASAPFTRRPPGMEKHFGHFLAPTDALHDDHDYLSDHSEASNVSGSGRRRSSKLGGGLGSATNGARGTSAAGKDKKTSDTIDMDLLEDVPAWFRTLRLHKYNTIFEPMKWQDIIKLSDDDLQAKGVAALGARRKMLKVFENIRAHCDANNISY